MFARLDVEAVRALVRASYIFEVQGVRERDFSFAKYYALRDAAEYSLSYANTLVPPGAKFEVGICDSPADAALLPHINVSRVVRVWADYINWLRLLLPLGAKVRLAMCPTGELLAAAREFAGADARILVGREFVRVYKGDAQVFYAEGSRQAFMDARLLDRAVLLDFTWVLNLTDDPDWYGAWKKLLGV